MSVFTDMNNNTLIYDSDFEECWKFENNSKTKVSVKDVLRDTSEKDSILWGFAPISPIHTGYDKIFYLLGELAKATKGKVQIVGTDVSAMLSHSLELEQTSIRAQYYRNYIENVWGQKTTFTLASDYIFSKEYQTLLLKLSTRIKENTVKNTWNSLQKELGFVYSYLYPLIQVLDVVFWRPKVVFAEYSQAKIYKIIPEISKALNMELDSIYFVYIQQSLDIKGKPLNKSTSKDRISIHENEYSLKRKLARCASFRSLKDNPLLDLLEFSILPFRERYSIDMKLDTGSTIEITNRDQLRQFIIEGELVLPESFELISSWFTKRLISTQLTYTYADELTKWIDLERVTQVG